MQDWRCSICGKLADYRTTEKFYCTEHWEQYIGIKKGDKDAD